MIHSNIQCKVTELENTYNIVLDTPIVRGLYRCIIILFDRSHIDLNLKHN